MVCLSAFVLSAWALEVDSFQTKSSQLVLSEKNAQLTLPEKKPSFMKRVGKTLGALVAEFNNIDTNYIEPQHYNFTVMAQSTLTLEVYRLKSKSNQSIVFGPESSIKVGPYFGYRWMFLGYTFDLSHMNSNSKKEFNLSLYSSMLGIDLFYRRTGNDYRIRSADFGDGVNTKPLEGMAFSGLNVGITGFNLYYIFNHRKFSYPAAFSQSTCQKRSAGSAIFGIGYTHHSLDLNYNELQASVERYLPDYSEKLDSGLMFNKVKYDDFSVYGGYGYNYVVAKNCLLAASLSLGIGYKRSVGDLQKSSFSFRDFSFRNFNIDGVGRFGFVWNNTKWYVGASAILHAYNYHKSQFSTNNFFGSVNVYAGFNFGKRKAYRQKKKTE